MKVTVKTTLVCLEFENDKVYSTTSTSDRLTINELSTCITTAINETIKLHNEVKNNYKLK